MIRRCDYRVRVGVLTRVAYPLLIKFAEIFKALAVAWGSPKKYEYRIMGFDHAEPTDALNRFQIA